MVVRPTKGEDLQPILSTIPGVHGPTVVDGTFRVKCDQGEAMVPPIVMTCDRAGIRSRERIDPQAEPGRGLPRADGTGIPRKEEGDPADVLAERMGQMHGGRRELAPRAFLSPPAGVPAVYSNADLDRDEPRRTYPLLDPFRAGVPDPRDPRPSSARRTTFRTSPSGWSASSR